MVVNTHGLDLCLSLPEKLPQYFKCIAGVSFSGLLHAVTVKKQDYVSLEMRATSPGTIWL